MNTEIIKTEIEKVEKQIVDTEKEIKSLHKKLLELEQLKREYTVRELPIGSKVKYPVTLSLYTHGEVKTFQKIGTLVKIDEERATATEVQKRATKTYHARCYTTYEKTQTLFEIEPRTSHRWLDGGEEET